ncbi:putative methyltransferase [Lachnellula subtilissima]|uniref:Putative methyltransferase n=1 Tax=Lachnellula subtilissima TaxID=602034 RepID=A0A8H8RBP3_9HELO|nr:putative methyltransferase [Lachnellula subtilissima]
MQAEPTDIIEADDDSFSDEGADVGGENSLMTSFSSSLVKGVEENGRTYASYGKEATNEHCECQEYGAPMDEQEMDRIDMAHAKYFMLLDKKRWLAPIPAQPQKVLDLACGTGIWSIDFADAYPSAEVTGVDIAPIQPKWTSPNCHFEIDDIEQPWTWKEESFDYIFARDLLLCIRDWPRLVEQCYKHLKPGGWLEFQCIDGSLKCDDGTVPESSQFKEYDRLLRAAATAFGTPLEDPTGYAKWFEGAGFEGVTEKVFKMPTSPWPKDPRLRLVGAFEQENLTVNLEGISLRVFQKGLGWGADESSVFFAAVRKDIRNRRHHSYYPFYAVYGQKPLSTAT